MSASGHGRARWAWMPVLLLMAALAALALAAPAAAQDGQDADISQSCRAGDGDGSDSNGSSSDDSGDCGNQRRVVQQSAGGDVSRSINQSQTFGDDDSVRTSEGERDRDRDDEEADDFEAQDDGASAASDDFDCEDFSSQSDAQAVLNEDSSDPFNLDADGDDRACEDEFGEAVRGAPEGGVETGGGGTLTPRLARDEDEPSAAVEAARIAGPVALALIVAGLLGLRRERTT